MGIELHRISDVEELMRWRLEVIQSVFGHNSDAALSLSNREYYASHIRNDAHVAVVATVDGIDAGCGGVCLYDELPSPDNPTGRCAYLMNIYVRPEFRERGVATSIVNFLVMEARNRRCGKVYLETTAAARPLYAAMGFYEMKDMMKL